MGSYRSREWSARGHKRRHLSAPRAGGEPLIPGCEGVKRSIIERVAIWFHRLPATGASGRTNRGRDKEHTRTFTVRMEGRTSKFCPEASAAAGTATESPRLQWSRLMINDRAVIILVLRNLHKVAH